MDIGDPLPDFTLPKVGPKVGPKAGKGTVSASDYAGRALVLYFYPRADTPGCTTQAVDFTASRAEFDSLGADVLGVSKDPVAKLEKFVLKRDLGIDLASDADSDLSETFGVWVEKNMYGKTYMGIERATFLFGSDGKLMRSWHKVRAKDHAEAVLDAFRSEVG